MSTGIPLLPILIFAAIVALGFGALAVTLILSGRRGRFVNDHPICRTCGFDLFNLPDEQKVCPECGADVKKPGAVVPGRREPHVGRLYCGYALAMLVMLGFGWTCYRVFSDDQSIGLLPDFLVALEARHASASTQVRAWRELKRRASAGGLSESSIATLLATALDLQSDAAKRWMPEVGDFVETARKQKRVDDESWKRYARQAVTLSLRVRSQIRVGDPLTAEVVIGPCRAGGSSDARLVLRNHTPRSSGDLIVERPADQDGGSHGQSLGSGVIGSDYVPVKFRPEAETEAAVGKHEQGRIDRRAKQARAGYDNHRGCAQRTNGHGMKPWR